MPRKTIEVGGADEAASISSTGSLFPNLDSQGMSYRYFSRLAHVSLPDALRVIGDVCMYKYARCRSSTVQILCKLIHPYSLSHDRISIYHAPIATTSL